MAILLALSHLYPSLHPPLATQVRLPRPPLTCLPILPPARPSATHRRSGFSPLTGFMNKEDYTSVVERHRLAGGQLFGLPVVLDTDREDVVPGDRVLLTYQGQVCVCVSVCV